MGPESFPADGAGGRDLPEVGSLVGVVEQEWAWTSDSVTQVDGQKVGSQYRDAAVEFAKECDKSNIGLHLQAGVADSGATNALTNPICAKYLSEKSGRSIQKWATPRHIQFGNSGRETSESYIDGGPFLGKISIIPSAPCTLVGMWDIISANCSVHFQEEKVELLFRGAVV